MKQVNLNNYAKFKLTDRGNQILEKHVNYMQRLTKLEELDRSHFVKVDEHGLEYMQLWDFMKIFGDSFHTGANPVTEDNVIYFE